MPRHPSINLFSHLVAPKWAQPACALQARAQRGEERRRRKRTEGSAGEQSPTGTRAAGEGSPGRPAEGALTQARAGGQETAGLAQPRAAADPGGAQAWGRPSPAPRLPRGQPGHSPVQTEQGCRRALAQGGRLQWGGRWEPGNQRAHLNTKVTAANELFLRTDS